MLPVRPEDASRYEWRTRPAVLRTPHRLWRFVPALVPPDGVETSGVEHVDNGQRHYAQRLIAAGERLQRRADGMGGAVIEGDVVTGASIALPAHTVEPGWEQ